MKEGKKERDLDDILKDAGGKGTVCNVEDDGVDPFCACSLGRGRKEETLFGIADLEWENLANGIRGKNLKGSVDERHRLALKRGNHWDNIRGVRMSDRMNERMNE